MRVFPKFLLYSFLAAGAVWLAASPVAAGPADRSQDLDSVIARHVAARGGEGWGGVASMKLTGSFTAFSETGPFTMIRQGGDRYYLDCMWSGNPVQVGLDGDKAWTVNPMFGSDTPQKVTGLDLQVLMQDVDLATPFFDYEARGHEVELLDNGDIDGQETLRLKVTRPDGFEETWHLHPETFLEVARESMGSDFGQPAQQITYFDDFRVVGGMRIPHYIETQWYTRNRVLEVTDVELNAQIDPEIFRMPLPLGMDKLAVLEGTWDVKVEESPQPGAPYTASERVAVITSDMSGGMVRERLTTSNGYEVEITMLYDRFRERYTRGAINDFTHYLDVQVGNFDDTGRLTLSNVETDTPWTGFGRTFHLRTSIFDLGEDGFKTEQATSVDGGETWWVNARSTYTRKKE